MVTDDTIIPVPSSRFVKIECAACGEASTIFSMSKSVTTCRHCGNVLTRPTGGAAMIFGSVLEQLDAFPKISIRVMHQYQIQTDGGMAGTASGAETRDVVQQPAQDNDLLYLVDPDKKQFIPDTNIILELISGADPSKFTGLPADSTELIILDRIAKETVNVTRDKRGEWSSREWDMDTVIDKLENTTGTRYHQVDHASRFVIKAHILCDSRKYSDGDDHLSETDCILLQASLESGIDLLTHDKRLQDALKAERARVSATQ